MLLAGCRVGVAVDLHVDAGGAGVVAVTVTLDPRAAAEAGDLRDVVRAADLEAAGWDVAGPRERDNGSVVVRATKPFASVAEANAVVDEVTGPDGPFSALTLTRQRSFVRTEVSVDGPIDLTPGLAVFSDADLAQRLGGEPLGIPVAEIEQRAGAPVAEAVTFDVRIETPGASGEWRPKLGERTDVALTGDRLNWPNLLLAGVSVAAATGAVVLAGRRRLDRYPR